VKRSIATMAALLALGLGACSSGDDDTAETGDAPEATEAAAAVVTPVATCADPQRGVAYFGYTNSGDGVVEIPVGDANSVTVPDGTVLTEAQPAVFAPGEQEVVFWSAFVDDGPSATWSLTGADGTARSATTDESTPACEFGPTLDPPDDREVSIASSVDYDGTTATVTFSLEGLGDESRCPSGDGWTPAEPEVTFTPISVHATEVPGSEPGTLTVEINNPAEPPFEGYDVAGFAHVELFVDVDDHCTDEAGATSEAWAASESLRDLNQIGTGICFGVVGDDYDEVGCDEGPVLAPTGGIRNRN
jgi:hypothetical protein